MAEQTDYREPEQTDYRESEPGRGEELSPEVSWSGRPHVTRMSLSSRMLSTAGLISSLLR